MLDLVITGGQVVTPQGVADAIATGRTQTVRLRTATPLYVLYWTAAVDPAGLVTFRWHALIERLRNPVLMFDAAGLALYAVLGTGKALAFGLSPFAATLLGIMSGIGGGIARDLLVARTPVVLQPTEIYAVAALAGGGIVAIAHASGWPSRHATGPMSGRMSWRASRTPPASCRSRASRAAAGRPPESRAARARRRGCA